MMHLVGVEAEQHPALVHIGHQRCVPRSLAHRAQCVLQLVGEHRQATDAFGRRMIANGHDQTFGGRTVAQNDLLLTANNLPASAFGFFLTSQTQGFVTQPAGSQGNLCLGGAIGRYVGAGQVLDSGAAGQFALTLDLNQMPTPTGLVPAVAGETWNFQSWFRDSVAGQATSNFTDAVSLSFL